MCTANCSVRAMASTMAGRMRLPVMFALLMLTVAAFAQGEWMKDGT
jgi:hypothetical protein